MRFSIMIRMPSLPTVVHSVAQVRAIDRYAIERLGIAGYTLMTRAGEAALAALRSAWPTAEHILVACGAGNNAGDGYVLARLARIQRLKVTVVALVMPDVLQGDALTAYRDFVDAGGTVQSWRDDVLDDVDVIVDALFGTGLSRPLDATWCQRIEALNASHPPVFSLDVPSGLDADSGAIRGAAIRAERTITFVGLKMGLYLGHGPDCTGTVIFDGLDIPSQAVTATGHVASRLDADFLTEALPPRRRSSHKGDHGHVLIVAGGLGMAGAARLAGEACLRAGAGRVTVATRAANVAAIIAGRPELMTRAVEDAAELQPLLDRVDLVAVGPGLGQDAWAQSIFAAVVVTSKPLVVDADALNLLAMSASRRDDWILTPHPGEAGRLLGWTAGAVQEDRLGAASAIARRYGGVVVLKGAGTLVVREGELPALCDYGNPGMASPGMGDVLTGVVAGLLAQMDSPWNAARVGVLAHALAGDAAARKGQRGLLASDLFNHLQACVNSVR